MRLEWSGSHSRPLKRPLKNVVLVVWWAGRAREGACCSTGRGSDNNNRFVVRTAEKKVCFEAPLQQSITTLGNGSHLKGEAG